MINPLLSKITLNLVTFGYKVFGLISSLVSYLCYLIDDLSILGLLDGLDIYKIFTDSPNFGRSMARHLLNAKLLAGGGWNGI